MKRNNYFHEDNSAGCSFYGRRGCNYNLEATRFMLLIQQLHELLARYLKGELPAVFVPSLGYTCLQLLVGKGFVHCFCQCFSITHGYQHSCLAMIENLFRSCRAVTCYDHLVQKQCLKHCRRQSLEVGTLHKQTATLRPRQRISHKAKEDNMLLNPAVTGCLL